MDPFSESTPVTDAFLREFVYWPDGLSLDKIRARLATARRFIDYEETLTDFGDDGSVLRWAFCGKPLREFLAEEPYVIVSNAVAIRLMWTFVPERRKFSTGFPPGHRLDAPDEWRPRITDPWCKNLLPDPPLPPPLLIMRAPSLCATLRPGDEPHPIDRNGRREYAKDLHALGVRSGEVYDDQCDDDALVYAPGCRLITRFD